MTRIGVNPARGKTTDYRPSRITITMLTYIPSLEGYFENRLEVLKLVIASLNAHTPLPHDLMIFDNGSCQEVLVYLNSLKRQGAVNYLLLSHKNIGKIDALRILFEAAPGDVIAYSDDDIFFYPGWLEAQLELLECFPNVGMVSGTPVRDAAGHANRSLEKLAYQDHSGFQVIKERRIPDDWEIDWALSTGRDPSAHLEATRDQMDLVFRVEKSGGEFVEAIAGANHFQFVGRKEIILKALPQGWSGRLMGAMLELDEAIDSLGYLRISTAGRFTRHLGNQLSNEIRQDAAQMGLLLGSSESQFPVRSRTQAGRKHLLLRLPGGRKVLHSLYRRIFDILFNS